MKKLLLIALLTVGLVALAMATGNKIVVEAEKYASIVPSMVVGANAQASGGKFIQIPLHRPHATSESAPTDQGRAIYNVTIPTAGPYRFWARTFWYDGCGNSFSVKFGDKPQTFVQDALYQRWHWVKGPIVQLPAGTVQVIVQYREDGTKLDQFLFSKNLNYVPVRPEH
jgi:hypothetical protein